jgi:hypothetical protein
MASEMRRAAQGLVDKTPARFESDLRCPEALERLSAIVRPDGKLDGTVSDERVELWERNRAGGLTATRFGGRFIILEPHRCALDGAFHPSPRVPGFLRITSIFLIALMAATAWMQLSSGVSEVARYLVTLATSFTILAFPFVILGIASNKQAAENRIARLVRTALRDADQ